MTALKKKWVAFKGNLTIPAKMVGEEKDTKVQTGEPVQVPAFYADSVVQDGIAEHCDAPKKKSAAKKSKSQPAEPKVNTLAEAKAAVTEAQAALDSVGLGKPAGAEIAALKIATDTLDALQG